MHELTKAMEAYKSAQKVDFFHLVVINHRREMFERTLQGERSVELTPEETRKIYNEGLEYEFSKFLNEEYEIHLAHFLNGGVVGYSLYW